MSAAADALILWATSVRTMVVAAHGMAAQLRDECPVDARNEATNVVAGLVSVDDLFGDLVQALREIP